MHIFIVDGFKDAPVEGACFLAPHMGYKPFESICLELNMYMWLRISSVKVSLTVVTHFFTLYTIRGPRTSAEASKAEQIKNFGALFMVVVNHTGSFRRSR